uniref:Cytochrome c-553 n=1 Tax=Chromera velia CCMP2878 TaxID=1169474 RepID=A0A0G4FGQ2_9ALVE|eukprot:Cvel_16858.t1-p1 / transcript=Cvel_16858.t1 / gene=Cvel_16858 / organism=Chromera_velia_CCMP2878 / gene_product=Cytochrome c6, putative / transcript_product=Cytochrome c6, putative / location=Cvel_scaffold1318:20437-20943(+) / protein_length=169 / sequence_SO=supercontig / SO=protein_coding / is_pseudo=false
MKFAALAAVLGLVSTKAFVAPGTGILGAQRRRADCQRAVMKATDASEEEADWACGLGARAVDIAAKTLPLAVAALAPASAFAEGDPELGELVFSGNCAACHAGGNNVVKTEKTLKKAALDENGMNSFDKVVYQVTNGKNAMPAFGGRLSEDDIQNVASFVLDQANGNKW